MKKKKFLLVNLFLPIVIGAISYYILFPDVFFVKIINGILGIRNRCVKIEINNFYIRFFRNYIFDILWGYSLIYALVYLICDNNTANLLKVLVIAIVFSVAIEFLQLLPLAGGTFDIWDVFAEVCAEVLAVFIIKKFQERWS